MRVLAVGNRYMPWSTGGYEVTWAGADEALRRSGHQVRVLTTEPDPWDLTTVPAGPGIHRELRWYWRAGRFPRMSIRAAAALERFNATVLRRHLAELRPHAVMWWAMGGMSLSLIEQVRRAGLPALAVVGDDWIVYGPAVDAWLRRVRRAGGLGGSLATRLAELLVGVPARLDLDRAGRFVFISRYTLSSARAQGWRLQDATVIHPGIDPRRFAARPPEPWRWRLLYCGRIDPRKGIDTAIRALPLLPRDARLRVDGGGDEDHRRELVALARELGVAGRVEFTHSPRALVPDVYAAADAVLFPVKWREPWGLVPLEAMSVGRTVVASRAGGGPAEYLQEGENCLQFEPDDPRGLAAAVRSLAERPDLRERLRAGGLATAASHREDAFHEALERELLEVASRRGAAERAAQSRSRPGPSHARSRVGGP